MMKTVIEDMRTKRDFVIFFVIMGLLIAMGLGAAFGEAVMWLWIVAVTVLVIVQLRLKCPYCGHLVQVKKSGCEGWKNLSRSCSSPKIWDYCPSCHADLTLPYDPLPGASLDEQSEMSKGRLYKSLASRRAWRNKSGHEQTEKI